MIYGATGIVITSAKGVSIFDAGAIIGADGTAVEFKTSSDAFTLGPGYAVTGNVIARVSGDAFQLGGAGAASFDLASIGTQYIGFTAFNVTAATGRSAARAPPTGPSMAARWSLQAAGSSSVQSCAAAVPSTCSAAPPRATRRCPRAAA